jgi:hypothetical protein
MLWIAEHHRVITFASLRKHAGQLARHANEGDAPPPASPVKTRGRPLEPHGVAIGDAEDGEQAGEGVSDECRVHVPQVSGAGENEHRQNGGPDQPNYGRLALFASHGVASVTYLTMNSRACHIEQLCFCSLNEDVTSPQQCFLSGDL